MNNGADINLKDRDEVTPLHCSAEKGHLSFVEYLVNKGADVNAKNIYGDTPLGLARKSNVIEFLQK